MKARIIYLLVLLVSLLTLLFTYYNSNYIASIEDAINKANISYDSILHTVEKNGYSIVFLGDGDGLSAGLLKKGFLGYKWIYGAGSKQFNENFILTRMFANLPTKNQGDDHELVSLTFGVINDNEIKDLKVMYRDKEMKKATIIETENGRIWFCFSDEPFGYDPEVIRVYHDGEEIYGWYEN